MARDWMDSFKKYIKEDPNIKGGMPVILGTRVAVAEIINFLQNDKTVDSVIKALKGEGVIITKDEVFAALEFAKHRSSDETRSSTKNK